MAILTRLEILIVVAKYVAKQGIFEDAVLWWRELKVYCGCVRS
jgi:hypothetical protein